MRGVRIVLAATCAAAVLLGFAGQAGAANLQPVANPDSASTAINTPVDINVLANDDIPSLFILFPPGIAILTPPEHGTASVLGNHSVHYVPDAGFTGEDTFEYLLCTSTGKEAGVDQPQCPSTSKAPVTVTVTPPPPTTTLDPTTTSLEPLAVTTTIAPATTSTVAAAATNELPRTGSGSAPLGIIGGIAIAAGAAALLAGRRRRSAA